MRKRGRNVSLQTVAGAFHPASVLYTPQRYLPLLLSLLTVFFTHIGKSINHRTSHECFAQNAFSSLSEPLKALCSNGRSIEPK